MNESVISLKQANYGLNNNHLHHSNLHLPSHFTTLTSQINTKSLGTSVGKCQLNTNAHMVITNGHSVSNKLNYHNSSHLSLINGAGSSKSVCTNGSSVFLDSEGDDNMISPSPEDTIDESNSCIEIMDHDDDDDDDDDDVSVAIKNADARVSSHRVTPALNARADCFLTETSSNIESSNVINQLLTSTPSKVSSPSANTSVSGHTLAPLNSSVDSSLLDLAAGGLFDSSIVSRVNLTAAFHDHMPCTKIYRKVLPDTSGLSNSSSVLGSVSDSLMSIMSPLKGSTTNHHQHDSSHHRNMSNPDHLDYAYSSLQGPSTNCICASASEEREQIKLLQEMILSHFDLIAFQQEQIQKKDRQLLALKQEREALVARNEKFEKKVKFLSKKLVSLAQCKQSSVSISSADCGDSSSASSKSGNTIQNGTSCNSNTNEIENYSNASNLLKAKSKGKVKGTVTPTGKVDCLSVSKKKRSASTCLSGDVSSTGSPGKKKQRTLSTSTSCKSQTSINSLSDSLETSCDSSSSIPSAIGGSSSSSTTPLPPNGQTPHVKRKLPIMKDFLTTDEAYDVVQMRDPTYEAACLARRAKLSIQAGVVVRANSTTNGKVNLTNGHTGKNGKASLPGAQECDKSIKNQGDNKSDCSKNGANTTKRPVTEEQLERIEVPTWRIINFVPSKSCDESEALDDEVFLKRHNKLELDERRRKRWDIQRLREQKHNEKLKQGRYYSNCAFINPEKNAPLSDKQSVVDSEFVSFYPDPLEAEVIEVGDRLPITAFGHPIPRLPDKDFSLPWKFK